MQGSKPGVSVCRQVSLVVACVLAVTACKKETSRADGTESTGASASPSAASAASSDSSPCTAITPAEAAAALGIPSLNAPEITSAPPVTLCNFSDGKHPSALSLRFERGRTLSDMPEVRKGHDDHHQKTTDFPGLGDAAFSFSLGSLNGLSFLHRGTLVMVMSEVPLGKLEGLSRTLIGRM